MCGQTSKLPEEGVAGVNWSTNIHLLASIAWHTLIPWWKKGEYPMFPLVNQKTDIPKRTVTGSCLAQCPVYGNLCLCLNSAETRCMQGGRAGIKILQWFITMQMVRSERETKVSIWLPVLFFLLARWGKKEKRVLRLRHIFSNEKSYSSDISTMEKKCNLQNFPCSVTLCWTYGQCMWQPKPKWT